MTLNQNQFRQVPIQGQMDLLYGSQNVLPCQVYGSSVATLIPGQAVKLVSTTTVGGPPIVDAAAADTDDVFGFVSYNQKNSTFAANAAVEIAMLGSVMWMTADSAIARGTRLMVVIASKKVTAKLANVKKTIVGFAVDATAADGDKLRVWINTPNMFIAQSFTDLADAPATLVSGDFIKVNASGTGLVNAVS